MKKYPEKKPSLTSVHRWRAAGQQADSREQCGHAGHWREVLQDYLCESEHNNAEQTSELLLYNDKDGNAEMGIIISRIQVT